VVERDLSDAFIPQLSLDRRFATAYNAALQLSTIVMHISGYRTKSNQGGHHLITFTLLSEFMSPKEQKRADYFNICRTKRNVTDYDRAGEISIFDLTELLEEIALFKQHVLEWLESKHPSWTKNLSKQINLLKKLRITPTHHR
jgi:hypothetical protein